MEEKKQQHCKQFQKSGICDYEQKNGKCRFIHELKMCENFERTGECRFGDNCKYAHENMGNRLNLAPKPKPIQKNNNYFNFNPNSNPNFNQNNFQNQPHLQPHHQPQPNQPHQQPHHIQPYQQPHQQPHLQPQPNQPYQQPHVQPHHVQPHLLQPHQKNNQNNNNKTIVIEFSNSPGLKADIIQKIIEDSFPKIKTVSAKITDKKIIFFLTLSSANDSSDCLRDLKYWLPRTFDDVLAFGPYHEKQQASNTKEIVSKPEKDLDDLHSHLKNAFKNLPNASIFGPTFRHISFGLQLMFAHANDDNLKIFKKEVTDLTELIEAKTIDVNGVALACRKVVESSCKYLLAFFKVRLPEGRRMVGEILTVLGDSKIANVDLKDYMVYAREINSKSISRIHSGEEEERYALISILPVVISLILEVIEFIEPNALNF